MSDVEKISDLDRAVLEIAKKEILLAVAKAQTAVVEQEKAELNRKLLITQVFMKYNLTTNDQLSEDGTILRNVSETTND